MRDRQDGFIGLVIVLVVSLLLLKYFFSFNLLEFLQSSAVADVFNYVKKFLLIVWNDFLVYPLEWFWNDVVIKIVWETLKDGYALLKGWVDTRG
jgi:hypothetical protein